MFDHRAKFRIDDLVRVKHGVTDVDYPDIPMGGWVGRILSADGDTCLVRWNVETLENIHPVYRKRCERDGNDIEEYWVNADDLEAAPIEPMNMEQPTEIITRPLSMNDQDDRICMVFGLTSDDPLPYDSKATELTYFNYLKAHLTFPFSATFTDPVKNRKLDMTVTGMCNDLPLDEGFGVVCEVLDGGEKQQMPLSELKLEPNNPNYQMVDDYTTWFVNSPEDGVDDDSDDGWDEDDDEEWDDEDEYGDDEDDLDDEIEADYHETPLSIPERVGRNDPCPYGIADRAEIISRYKHLRTVGRNLNSKLVKRLSKDVLYEGGKNLGILQRNTLVFNSEDESSVLMDYCIYDVYRNGRNAVEQYLVDSAPDPESDEMACLRAMQKAVYSLFVVESVMRGFGATVRDILSNKSIAIVDMGFGDTAQPGLIFASRLLFHEDFVMTGGAALPISVLPEDKRQPVTQMLAKVVTPDDDGHFDPAPLIRACLEHDCSSHVQYQEPTGRLVGRQQTSGSIGQVGRNDPCPCGSGKKFKKCCLGKQRSSSDLI